MFSIAAAFCWLTFQYFASETCLVICQKFDNFVTSKLKYVCGCNVAGRLPHQINCQSGINFIDLTIKLPQPKITQFILPK